MTKFVQIGTVVNGKVTLRFPDHYRKLIQAFEGEEVKLTVQRKPKGVLPRSLRQNGYLWAVPYALIAEHTGYSSDEIHSLMASKFLKEMVTVFGDMFSVIKSTTKLNTSEFEEYVGEIRKWAEENLSVGDKRFRIPLPNETEYLD